MSDDRGAQATYSTVARGVAISGVPGGSEMFVVVDPLNKEMVSVFGVVAAEAGAEVKATIPPRAKRRRRAI
jgi:hypothetical protein